MPPNINSPAPTDDAAIKGTDAGVKKPAPKKKIKNNGFKNKNARVALQKMHVFFKAHRKREEYKDLSFYEQQKELGKLWKASPENPKNNA